MNILHAKSKKEFDMLGAEVIADVIRADPHAVLGLATGSTPIGMYGELIRLFERKAISFKHVSTLNLDEYVGLKGDDPNSYRAFMRSNLFDGIDVDINNTHIPCGDADDLDAECKRYSKLISDLPRAVQVLGLGRNGHIGFNEPGTPFGSVTHVVDLTENTIKANSRLFERESDVPRRAITMGIAEIMAAKKILVLATGKDKARAVHDAVLGEVDESCPASILRRHGDVTFILDGEAADELL